MKKFLTKLFGIQVKTLRKYSDPYDLGTIMIEDGKFYLALKEFRRGFYTIYTVTEIKPSRLSGLYNEFLILYKQTAFSLGLFTAKADLNA